MEDVAEDVILHTPKSRVANASGVVSSGIDPTRVGVVVVWRVVVAAGWVVVPSGDSSDTPPKRAQPSPLVAPKKRAIPVTSKSARNYGTIPQFSV